jgi:signal transduction histidine kinase
VTTRADDPPPAEPAGEGVVVLAPVGCDALVICQTLAVGDVACSTVSASAELIARVPETGTALVTQEALTPSDVTELLAVLAAQPAWSDLPIVLLLASDGGGARGTPPHLAALVRERNVTVLERPVPAFTLLTTVQASLAARRRQYDVRDLLDRERTALARAEAAMQVKDEFLATVSHELRTPLSAILMWSQLLEAGRLTEARAREGVHAIAESARAQSQLVEDLLDVSRMVMGRLRLNVQRCALGAVVQAAAEVVRPMADAKGVQLVLVNEAPHDLVLADPDRVQQICWNLLSNSVKFTPAGGVITILLAQEPEHVRLAVTDTGQGIDPDLLPYVFDRLRQDPRTPAPRDDGLGLGLSIAKHLVELHGGTISARSTGCGQGATFEVQLPSADREGGGGG